MISRHVARRFAATLALSSGLTALLAASAAPAADMPERAASAMSSPACKEAMQSAWFERQRQLTDGDTDPTRALPLPRECRVRQAASDEEIRRERIAAHEEERDTKASSKK